MHKKPRNQESKLNDHCYLCLKSTLEWKWGKRHTHKIIENNMFLCHIFFYNFFSFSGLLRVPEGDAKTSVLLDKLSAMETKWDDEGTERNGSARANRQIKNRTGRVRPTFSILPIDRLDELHNFELQYSHWFYYPLWCKCLLTARSLVLQLFCDFPRFLYEIFTLMPLPLRILIWQVRHFASECLSLFSTGTYTLFYYGQQD